MGWEAWITLVTVVLMVAVLARNIVGPEVVLLGAMTLLMTLGVFSEKFPEPRTLVAGFGNAGLVTVGVLYVVAAGLTQTGAMQLITAPLLGRPRNAASAQSRIIFPVAALSAFLNNTPIVAMLVPVINDWSKKIGVSPSKLLMPLSFAAILGGVCTLVGTSTNLVVNGLLLEGADTTGMGMFEIGMVGLPCAIAGTAYIVIAGRWLLPERKPAFSSADDPREYTVEVIVDPAGNMVGQTIEQAGLRHLPGLYLVEIERDGELRTAVGPEERLHAGDRLVFVGVIESVVDLRRMRGLTPAADQISKIGGAHGQRLLIEAVVSNSCPLIGKSIREGRFRTTYNAAVIAVARNGERIRKKIGDIVLQPGDTLLLEAHKSFAEQRRNSRDFFLVSTVEGSTPPRHDRAWIALAILALMVVAVTVGLLTMLNAALLAAGFMWLSRCTTASAAKQSIDWQVLLVIGAALGLGLAVESSGLAHATADGLLSIVGDHPVFALLAIYLLTNLFTEMITNNAAAVLIFPIAKATAASMGVDFMPFVAIIMIAASASFATPIGYQTNLMVFGPGGYRYSDYLRFGLPLNIIVMIVAVGFAPWVWPF